MGLTKDATDKQIKKAFRKLSLQYHPDKNKGNPEAEAKFKEISDAYDVLSDPEKRQVYDIDGEEGLKNAEARKNRPSSPFDVFFGGGQNQRKGPDMNIDMDVTLEELYNGAEKKAKINRHVVCPKCRGTGAKGGETKDRKSVV